MVGFMGGGVEGSSMAGEGGGCPGGGVAGGCQAVVEGGGYLGSLLLQCGDVETNPGPPTGR